MESGKDGDGMSGIEPLESSTATSALLQASPGSIGKLSLSFGSYHSSLQSSPNNPDNHKYRENRPDMDIISPLHPQPSAQSSVQNGRGQQQSSAQQSSNPATTSSMPNTPFTRMNTYPEDSKRLMVSADGIAQNEHRPCQYSNHSSHGNNPKRELFSSSNPGQSYRNSTPSYPAPTTVQSYRNSTPSYPAPTTVQSYQNSTPSYPAPTTVQSHRNSTPSYPAPTTVQSYRNSTPSYPAPTTAAYTPASRSYKSYDANGHSYDYKSHDQKMHDLRQYDHRSHDHMSHDHRSHDLKLGLMDKPANYTGDVNLMQPSHHEERTEFSSPPRKTESHTVEASRHYLGMNSLHNPQLGPAHQEIAEMEKVRESLHQMLNASSSSRQQDSGSITPSEGIPGISPAQDMMNSVRSVKTDALLSARAYADISPMNIDSGFGLSGLKSFTNNVSQDVTETTKDSTLNAENHMLRDGLEKERYRRKHCEKQIAELQSKLLETQQQLAVAISTDKKKDAMIEQLDKTLARLVEGWKKQDQEKVEALEQMKSQKDTVEKSLKEMQKLYSKQTVEVNQVKNLLTDFEKQTKLAAEELESQISSLEQERSSLTAQLQREQTRVQELLSQHESDMEMSQQLQRQLRETQQSLHKEKEKQHSVEEKLHEQLKDFEKDQMNAMDKEKAKADEQAKKAHEAVELLTVVQRDVEKLKEQLECAVREKENSQLELNLQEARFEASQRKQDAEMQENMEKTLNKRLTELQDKVQHRESEMQDSHRAQITELQDQHQKDIDQMRTAHQQEILQREKRLETLRQQYQERLDENQEELAKINNKMEDVQHEKTLLVGKLQDVLQAYYSGTLTDSSTQSVTPTQMSQVCTQSVTPTQMSQQSSPKHRTLFANPPKQHPTTPARREEKPYVGTAFDKGLGSKRDGLNQLTASQIAALHTTVHRQHKTHHQQPFPQSQPNQHHVSYPTMDLSDYEISHLSGTTNNPGEISHQQYPLENSRTSHHAFQQTENSRTSHHAFQQATNTNHSTPSKMHLFRDMGLLAGAQPIKLQANTSQDITRNVGDFYTGQTSVLGDELATLEQDPDRSFGESFLDGRGYASGEFLPLKAVNNSPTGSILSTGPLSESVSEVSSAPLYHQARSNAMLLEKLAEHEQRQMALQHYIGMLLNRSPGATEEEERNTTNKPVDTSVVTKERLPIHKGSTNFLNPRSATVNSALNHLQQQQPVRQKVVPNPRHIPAERLQTNTAASLPADRLQTKTPASRPLGVTSMSQKGKTDNTSRASFANRPVVSTKATVVSRTAPSRQSVKGKVTRIQASNEKRNGCDLVLKRKGTKGK